MTDEAAKQGRALRSMVGAIAVLFTLAIAPTAASAESLPVVSAGDDHACAITRNHNAICWGGNKYGQADVPAGRTWSAISAGTRRSCGVTTEGVGYCWGLNRLEGGHSGLQSLLARHALSNCGVTTEGRAWDCKFYKPGATAVPSGKEWKVIDSSSDFACGVTTEGEGFCWGGSEIGRRLTMPSGKTWSSVSVSSNGTTVCGVTTDAQVLCKGGASATRIPSGKTWSAVSAGSTYSCGVTTNGEGLCWGSADASVLAVPAGEKWESISAAWNQACGVTTEGSVYCWGSAATTVPEGRFPYSNPSWNPPTVSGTPVGSLNPTLDPVSVSFEGTAGTTFECSIDWGPFAPCTSPASNNASTDGEHSIAIRQVDGDHKSDPKTVRWTVDTTALAPELDGVPSARTKSTTASIAVSGEQGATFTCSLDGAAYASCTSPKNLTGLKDGAHTFAVKQTDQAGNTSEAQTATWTIDTTPPAKPGLSGAPDSPTEATTAALTFTGELTAAFTCSLDGAAYAPCTSPRNLIGLKDGTHSFAVKQTDLAGNTSPAESVTWTVDATIPVKPGLSGRPASPTKSTSATFTVTGELTAAFTCSLDGADYTSCTSPKTLTGLSEGTHSFAVKQTDLAGNTSPAETATWTVDTTAPEKPGLSGTPDSPTRSTGAAFTFTGEANAKFTCSLDGGAYASCASPRNLTGLTDGTHTLSLKQTDQAGNTGPADTATWTVDTTPPLAPVLSSGPSGSVYVSTATFGFARPGATGFTCALDGRGSDPCTSPAAFEDLAVGLHTFSVSAVDTAGNVSSATTRRWTVLPEQPTITSAPSGTINPTKTPARATFTGVARAKFQCSKDKGAWTACTSPFAFGSAVDGPHTLQVRQVVSRSAVLAFVSEAVTASWKVDTEAPSKPSLKGFPAANTTSRDATIALTAEAGATLECRIDGEAASPCSSPLALTDLVDGVHTLTVTATDSVGNVSAATVATWRVDTVAPAPPTFTGHPNPITGLVTATFAFKAESGASLRCSIDGGNWAQCTSPRELSKLSTGDHSFAVKATDAAGNVSDPAIVSWTVETKAPPAALLEQKPDQTSGSSAATFSITPPPYSTVTCSLDNAPFTACGSTRSFTGLRVGRHTFQVKVTRGAATAVTSYTWTIDLTVPAKPVWSSAPSGYFGFSGTSGMTLECSIDSGAFEACVSPLKIPALPDGDHAISIRQKSSNGKVSSPLIGTWTVDVGGHPPVVDGTSVPAYQTGKLLDERWRVATQLVVSAGGTNANSVLTLAQVSYSVSKPASAPLPKAVSEADGVYDMGGTPIGGASSEIIPPGEFIVGNVMPTWVRVGNAAGQWTDWLPVTVRATTG